MNSENKEVLERAERRREALRNFIDTVVVARMGLSMSGWAKKAKASEATLRAFLSGGRRSISHDTYAKLAAFSGVSVSVLLGERDTSKVVPLVGFLRSGSMLEELKPYDDVEYVEAPPWAAGRPLVAFRVDGNTSFPAYWDQEVIFFEKRSELNEEECLRKACVIKVAGGKTYVGILRKGSEPGMYNIERPNLPMMENQSVEWASPIDSSDKRNCRV